jgi:dTDP-4-dehydrorhamnose reductase
MRAVVIGGSGQIGGWLLRVLVERGHATVATFATKQFPGLVHLDVADLPRATAWLRDQRPDVVFYPAGFTWVDQCERDPALARSANVTQPLELARASTEIGAKFVYFSTDYVFDGQAGPYDETALPRPLSVYGQAKLEAEQALGGAHLTLRTTWVHGPEGQGKNFAYQLIRSLSAGHVFTCPSDQFSTPSYGPDVARAAVLLAEGGRTGLFHVAGPEFLDRVRFATVLAESFGFDPSLIIGKPTAELAQAAARPLKGGLLTPRLDACLPGVMRPLADCLADFHARLAIADPWAAPLRQGSERLQ